MLERSRHTGSADDAWAIAAGCDAVLHEPGSPDALIREVRRLEGDDPPEPSDVPARDRSRT